MTVMRSVFYVPGNNEKMVGKAPEFPPKLPVATSGYTANLGKTIP